MDGVFASGYNRTSQGSLTALGSEITALGSNRADYTSVANFNLDTRLTVACKNKNSSSSTLFESGVVSASLGFRLVGA